MRVLVVIPHFCGAVGGKPTGELYASQMSIAPRVFALREQIIALKRNFGASRSTGPQTELATFAQRKVDVDIVIVTVADANILHLLDIAPTEYAVEYFNGEPLMLSFETQRVARERAAGYDIVAMMEDDLIVHDPSFLQKIAWFQEQFGSRYVLQPQRMEVSRAGAIGKMLIEPTLSKREPAFAHGEAQDTLKARFLSENLTFTKASNPHSGTWFLTAEQFRIWALKPYFYDRDASWVGPLESAATRGLAMTFPIYRCASDAYFLEVEHYGVRYAKTHAHTHPFRSDPFAYLPDAQSAAAGNPPNDVLYELMLIRSQLKVMQRQWSSRSRLARRWLQVTLKRTTVGD